MSGFSNIAIQELIPQRNPFVLVDSVRDFADGKITTLFLIDDNHLLVKDGKLTEPGLIENMAQSAACLNGLRSRIENLKAPVGFIGSVNNLLVHFLPDSGKEIVTEVIEKNRIFNALIIGAKVFCGGLESAECEMKIFLMEDQWN